MSIIVDALDRLQSTRAQVHEGPHSTGNISVKRPASGQPTRLMHRWAFAAVVVVGLGGVGYWLALSPVQTAPASEAPVATFEDPMPVETAKASQSDTPMSGDRPARAEDVSGETTPRIAGPEDASHASTHATPASAAASPAQPHSDGSATQSRVSDAAELTDREPRRHAASPALQHATDVAATEASVGSGVRPADPGTAKRRTGATAKAAAEVEPRAGSSDTEPRPPGDDRARRRVEPAAPPRENATVGRGSAGTSAAGRDDTPRAASETQPARAPDVPPGPGTAYAAARLFIEQQRYAEAIETLSTSFRSPPGDWEAWYLMGTAQLALGRLEDSEQSTVEGLARNATVPQLWVQRAMIAQQRGNHDAALHALGRAAGLQPDMPEVALNMAYSFDMQGDLDRATAHYQRFLTLTEHNAAYYTVRKKVLTRVMQLHT